VADLLGLYQIVAALAALFLFGLLVFGIVRRPNATYLSLLMRGVLIPAAAFAWYALFPVDLSLETPITWIGISLIMAGLLLGHFNQRLVFGMRGSVASARLLKRQVLVGVVAIYISILGISGVLWIFEPAFAVANVALSLAWAAVWIPERFRRATGVVSVDVEAEPARAWDLMLDPDQRDRYQVNVMDYSVEPPGPLHLGSRITARLRVPLRRPIAGSKEFSIEWPYLVTDFVPGSTFTISALETQEITRTELTPVGSGTRITISSYVGYSILVGIAGSALEMKRSMRQTLSNQQSSLVALKALLASTT
jgi:hypothetical protein